MISATATSLNLLSLNQGSVISKRGSKMSEYSVKVTATGFPQVKKMLTEARKRMSDLTVPLKQGGNLMLRSLGQNFKAGGRPIMWKGLKPATVKFKASHGYSSLPLTRSGALQRSVTFVVRGKNRLAIGTSIPYGATHQFGDPKRNIPKRPYLVFQREDLKNIERLIVAHITGRSIF